MTNTNVSKNRQAGSPRILKNQQRAKQISARFTKEELYRLEEIRVKEHAARQTRELAREGLEQKKKLNTGKIKKKRA
ncbi:MAG: hypothetical protein LBU34_02780 [Planctomycetaceae bacterium]|jgi:hypothetical protein|nr:hypothetical protein [Planctomycetaceae bacterium]